MKTRTIIQLHDILCDTTTLLITTFVFQIVLLFTNMTLFQILCFFEVFHNYFHGTVATSELEAKVYFSYDLIWLIYCIYFIMILFISTTSLNSEAQSTKVMMSKFDNILNGKEHFSVSQKY